MKIVFADQAWDDFTYWVSHDRKIAKRIIRLIKEIERDPFDGIGKPEPLKHDMAGFWSRRITDEHHLVYSVEKNQGMVLRIGSRRCLPAVAPSSARTCRPTV